MLIKIVNTPSKGTLRILSRKVTDSYIRDILAKEKISAVGLVQGKVAEIIVSADIAEKTSNVEVAEISGNCPQNTTTLGIFGDISAVNAALEAIKKWDTTENKAN